MKRVLHVYLDADVEKSHGINICIGRKVGINFSIQWRSWQCDDKGYDPWMLYFNVFVYGTFLGFNPHTTRACCSNGINLFHWRVFNPQGV